MSVTGGQTDVSRYVLMKYVSDNTNATGLTITDFDLQYTREGQTPAAKVDATALVANNSPHADNKMIEVDPVSSPGLYRVDWPDAAFAAGVESVYLSVTYAGGTVFPVTREEVIDPPVNVEQVSGVDEDIATGTALADVQSDVDDILAALGGGGGGSPVVTPIDVSTNRGKVRLLIGDTGGIIFSDDYIDSFLEQRNDDVYLASALALRSIAASAALVAKLERSLNITIDRKSVPLRLLEVAAQYETMTEDAPAIGIAERPYTIFNTEDIILHKALREQV
jgi:hypothetical protein